MISQQGAFCLYYYTEDASFTTDGATHDERTTDETRRQQNVWRVALREVLKY